MHQDTNRTQYDLITLLVTDGKEPQDYDDWAGRSVFVVGDDQSIYSFRAADFTILMGFQDDFATRLRMRSPARWSSWRRTTAPPPRSWRRLMR